MIEGQREDQSMVHRIRELIPTAASVVALAGCSASNAKAVHGVITWDGGGARICVTDENAICPSDKNGKVTGGHAFWVIDATCFNGGHGMSPPVTYAIMPDCAKDMTADVGGSERNGPDALHVGGTYKVSVVGFGGDPSVAQLSLVPDPVTPVMSGTPTMKSE